MNIRAQLRFDRSMARAQSAWDSMSPPDDEEAECIDDEPDFEAMLERQKREEG